MLIRAVCDYDENTESTTEIFDSFGLSGSRGTSGGTSIHHTEGLRECYVTTISKWSNAKTFFDTEELILVNEFDISDCNADLLSL
jgi:hypothetical protein